MSDMISQEEIEKMLNNMREPEGESSNLDKVQEAKKVSFSPLEPKKPASKSYQLQHLKEIPVSVAIELAGKEMTVREILSLKKGSLIKTDKIAGEIADLLINDRPLAKGEVVVINEMFGIRVMDIDKKKMSDLKSEKG